MMTWFGSRDNFYFSALRGNYMIDTLKRLQSRVIIFSTTGCYIINRSQVAEDESRGAASELINWNM